MRRGTCGLYAVLAVATAVLCAAPVFAEKPSRPSAPSSGPPSGQPSGYASRPPVAPPAARPPGPPPNGYNRYARHYPPPGHVVPALPRGYHTAYHHHDHYYYGGGIWYAPYGSYYRVIAPPIGVVVSFLPNFYTTVWFGSVPYYYANSVYYVRRTDGPGYVVTEPPGQATDRSEPSAVPASDEFFVYPREGQNEQAQARDRYECHRWAVSQTGFDPSQAQGGVPESQNAAARSDYRRAITACLEARGYTVR
jgi:hypothetical protein